MIIEEKYHDLVKECEELDYSDTEAIFLYANNELSKYSWELALVVMVNIFIKDPDIPMDEISEHIILEIEYEGSRTTYNYMKQKYDESKDIRVKKNLDFLMGILENKYAHMKITLKK
jgi:hypothetical protein